MSSRSKSVLVVDDDPFARAIVKAVARTFTVVEASDAAEAFKIICTGEHPDLIVLDLAMPELSGLDALKALRGEAIQYSGPVLVWSARYDPVAQQELGKAGVRWLQKPVDLQILADEIERTCSSTLRHND